MRYVTPSDCSKKVGQVRKSRGGAFQQNHDRKLVNDEHAAPCGRRRGAKQPLSLGDPAKLRGLPDVVEFRISHMAAKGLIGRNMWKAW